MLDLQADALQILKDEFTKLHLRYPKNAGLFELYIDYLDLQSKLIRPSPRRLHVSGVVTAKAATLPQSNAAALEAIKNAFKAGQDVRGFLSDKSVQLKYRDGLLNDLKLHHLHLDTRSGKNGFVKRSAWLLLVWVEEADAYLIDIRDHNEQMLWSDAGLLGLVESSFPALLEGHELHGISALAHSPSNEERAKLREANINVFTSIGNSVYAPPGGGTALNGTNITHVMTAQVTIKALSDIEEKLKSPNGYIYKQVAAVHKSPRFKLRGFAGNTSFTLEIVGTPQVLRFTLESGTYKCVMGELEEIQE